MMKDKLIILLFMLIALPAMAAPWRLEADLLEYSPEEDRALAQGAVFLEWGDYTLTANSAQFALGETQIKLSGPRGRGAGLYLAAQDAVMRPGNVELFGSQLTGCGLPNPEYLLFSQHVQLTEKRVSLWGNRLKLFWLPKIPLPPLSFPRDSQLPLPRPQFGSSATRGIWAGLAIPNFFGTSRQGTLTLLASAKEGLIASQELEYNLGSWHANAKVLWESGLWGGVEIRRGPWRLVAQREPWAGDTAFPLVKIPELSYSTQGSIGGLTLRQNLSFGNLQEGDVESLRLRSQTILGGVWSLGKLELAASGLLVASRYSQEQMLGLSLASTMGRSWQLGDFIATASVGGSLRQARGSTPFRHDAPSPGLDLTFSGSLKRGAWKLAIAREGSPLESPSYKLSMRRDGHCFYWELDYNERDGAVGLKMGLR